jgi:hypothetical protein
MPVSAKSSGVLYNPTTGRRTISSATRLEKNAIVRTNTRGTFLTTSSDRDVQSAVDLLNNIRSGTKVFGQVSSLVVPKLLGGGEGTQSDGTLTRPGTAMSADCVMEAPTAAYLPGEKLRMPLTRPLSSAPPAPLGTALTWHVGRNMDSDDASLAVAARLASRRVTPLDMHRAEKLSVEPAVEPADVTDVLEPVPMIRQLREDLRQEADWMKYWGNLERMHLFHKSLISRLTDAEATAAREHNDVAWMHDKLQALLKESFSMDEVMCQHQALAEEAVKRERGRQDSLMEHNALLNAKIVEMRRQVALTERSAHLLRGELDASLDAANKLRSDLEGIQDKHRIDLLQLRRELAPDESGDRLRRQRLETLEAETTRKDDMLATLQTTLDVLEEEKRRLAEKVASLSAAADVNTKGPSHSGGSAIDAVTIQNMTARQYQRREAELVASNTELRQANAALEVGVDTLKDRLSRYTTAVERELMQRHETPLPSDVPPPTQTAGRTPSAGAGKRGSVVQKSHAPAAVQYACSPLVFPDMASLLNRAAVATPVPNGAPNAVVEFRKQLVAHSPVTFDVFRDAASKLWASTEASVPEHPRRDPSGARESTHAWLCKAIETMTQGMVQLVEDCNHAVAASAKEASEKTVASEHELALLSEQHAQAMTAQNTRINELYDEVAALKEQLQAAQAQQLENPKTASSPPQQPAEGAVGPNQLMKLSELVNLFAESSKIPLPTTAPLVTSPKASDRPSEVFDAAILALQDVMTGVVRRLSEKPTEVPTAITSPKRLQVSAEVAETQRRAHEEALALQKNMFSDQLAAGEAARLALAQRLKEAEMLLSTTEPRFRELQERHDAMTKELAAARSEAAASAAVRSVITSPTTKSINRPLSPCRECTKLRDELRVALQQVALNEREKREFLHSFSTLEHERAGLLEVADRLSKQLAAARGDNGNTTQRSVTSHREKWTGGTSRPTSAPRQSPSHHIHTLGTPREQTPVSAMRQRIHHDRAPLADNSSRRGHDAHQAVLQLELDPLHSLPGNTVYYAHTPVEPQSHRQVDVLHYMRSLKDAEFIARTPSPVPVTAAPQDSSAQYSPVPFFEIVGLPRAPSPTAFK